MKIAVQNGGLTPKFGLDKSYQIISEAGFDGLDVNLDHLLPGGMIRSCQRNEVFNAQGDELLAYFKPYKDAAEKYGLQCFQAHAPFPTYVPEPSNGYNDYLLEVLQKTIAGCEYIGCKRLVVHPFFLPYNDVLDPQAEWDLNIKHYSALIPAAKKHGVTICLENMFTVYRGKVYTAICSDITTACKYVDTLNEIAGERVFGFCVDTGHLLLLGKDIKQSIIQLGDRIECLHVHDNDAEDDLHMPPYTGKLDWERFVEGLKAIQYNKPLSFETFNIHNHIDPALSPSIMRFIHDCGRRFAERIEE